MRAVGDRTRIVEAGPAADGPSPTRLQSSPDQIVADIVQGLYEGRFVPGQRLVEADLTQSYRVSRGTVREALTRLAAERIVTLSPHRGAQIRRLTREETRDILVLLELLIGLAARLAAGRIGDGATRDRFVRASEALLAFAERPTSFALIRARNTFYRTLVEVGSNQELIRILPGMHVHLLRVQFRLQGSDLTSDRFPDYRAITTAVLAGNGRKAELAGRKHIRRVADFIEALPDEAFAARPDQGLP